MLTAIVCYLTPNKFFLMLRYLPFLLLSMLFVACTEEINEEKIIEIDGPADAEALVLPTPGFIHAVYFWIDENADETLKNEWLETGLAELAKVESLQAVYYGPPANTVERGVVDNSYDVAWICHFATPADQEAYQVDPIHLEFVEKYKSLWSKVIVYDNLVEGIEVH